MKLTKVELDTAVWKRIEAHLNEQIESLRRQNDGDMDEIATAKLRGRISAIKSILALGIIPEPVQPSED